MNGDQQGIFSFISYIFADLNKKKNCENPTKFQNSSKTCRQYCWCDNGDFEKHYNAFNVL